MNFIVLLTVLSAFVTANDARTEVVPEFFEAAVGSWEGTGELFGQPTEFTMSWKLDLNDRFATLNYSILGARGLTAIAHYRFGEGETADGVWLDTRGEILQLEATVAATRLTTIWRLPTETGKTAYHLVNDGIEVSDYYHDGDDWVLFGKATYVRAASAP